MNSPVSQIKERLTIEDVVSSYIKLDQAGANLKAKCPFHSEKTPSFFISPARGSYYCFGCGASGDIFTFVEEFEGLDFKGALKFLADKANVTLGDYRREKDGVAKGDKERLYAVMTESTEYFERNLTEAKDVFKYLKDRGLNDQSIQYFHIGYIKNDWRLLYEYLRGKGFTDREIEGAGLIKKTDKGFYDRFRGRVMFPIADSSGRIVAFSGRLFTDNLSASQEQAESQPKYLNSPETMIFSKSAILYGLDKAKGSIRKNNFSILVEGQVDLVLAHQAGYKNTIATSGTALAEQTMSRENVVSNLGLIRRLSQNIVLAFDGDKAGLEAVKRAGRIALSLGMDVKVAPIPVDTDPADLISDNIERWKEVVKNSKHIIEFLLDKVLKGAGGDIRKVGKEIKDMILPYVNLIESSIDKVHFIKKISTMSTIPETALMDDLKKIEQEQKYEKQEITKVEESINKVHRKDNILRRLMGIILWQRTLKESNIDIHGIIKELTQIVGMTKDDLFKQIEGNEEDLIFEAEVFYGEEADLKKDTMEMISNLKEEYLKEALSQKMKQLHLAEEVKDREKSAQVLKECQDLNDQIQNIKNSRLDIR